MRSSRNPNGPSRNWLTTGRRRALIIAGVILFLPAACSAWMLRDPVPGIMERRSELASFKTEELSRDSGHVSERVSLTATSGLKVDMILRRPDGPATGSNIARRPVFVILGGYKTGDRAATLITDTGGNIVVALAYPFEGNIAVKGLRVLPEVVNIRRAILDTPSAVMLALDYLLSRNDVNSNKVEMVGASFGAPFSVLVGALDPRITRVWSVYGAARLSDQIDMNLKRSVKFGPARRAIAELANILMSGPRLAPELWAPRIAPRPFIMINSRDDERMPRAAVDALYESAQEPKEIIWMNGAHLHRTRPEVLSGLVKTVLARAAN